MALASMMKEARVSPARGTVGGAGRFVLGVGAAVSTSMVGEERAAWLKRAQVPLVAGHDERPSPVVQVTTSHVGPVAGGRRLAKKSYAKRCRRGVLRHVLPEAADPSTSNAQRR